MNFLAHRLVLFQGGDFGADPRVLRLAPALPLLLPHSLGDRLLLGQRLQLPWGGPHVPEPLLPDAVAYRQKAEIVYQCHKRHFLIYLLCIASPFHPCYAQAHMATQPGFRVAQPEPRANPTVVQLTAYNTLALASGTVYQWTVPNSANAYLLILNLGTGNLFIKGDATVLATDPASFKLPANIIISPLVSGKLFVVADAAISVSVMVVGKQ